MARGGKGPVYRADPETYEVTCTESGCTWSEYQNSLADGYQALEDHLRDWHGQ